MNLKNIETMSFNEIDKVISSMRLQADNDALNLESLVEASKVLVMDSRKNVKTLGEKTLRYIDKQKSEIIRVTSMYRFDNSFGEFKVVAGVDEVGRGPLAGPIVSAAVVLDLASINCKDIILGIKDSKKLSSKSREELSCIIKDKALAYSISALDYNMIDSNGIAWCNNEIFKVAVGGLKLTPELVLSDGYPIKNFNIKNVHIIKGDEKSACIACASIIAKVYRDHLMEEYHKIYPYYNFAANAGYGTEEHINALKKHGPCKIHRMSFLRNII